MTENRMHGYSGVPHPLKPKHCNGYEFASAEWFQANDRAATRAMRVESIDYGAPKRERPGARHVSRWTRVGDYTAPSWKTAPDHSWIKELLADVEEFEKRLAAAEGWRMKDIAIR